MGKLVWSPFAWVVAGALFTIAPMALIPGVGWIGSFLAFSGYSAGAPIVFGFRDRWWLTMTLMTVGWVLTFFAIGALPATRELREGATVFLLPMMVYPVAVLISAGIRIARWRRARGSAPPAGTAS